MSISNTANLVTTAHDEGRTEGMIEILRSIKEIMSETQIDINFEPSTDDFACVTEPVGSTNKEHFETADDLLGWFQQRGWIK